MKTVLVKGKTCFLFVLFFVLIIMGRWGKGGGGGGNWRMFFNYQCKPFSSRAFISTLIKHRGYLLFFGEYQIYFIECVENIRNFTSA